MKGCRACCLKRGGHPLFKPKHTVRELFIHLLPGIWIVGIGMMAVIEFDNVETASINVEVNIPFLKVGRDSFPYRHFRMQLFHRAPGGIADAPAVRFGRDKQKIEIASHTVYSDNDAADSLPVLHDPISLAAINGLFDGLAGDDFVLLLLEVVIAATEFFQCTVIERLLIIQYVLVSVIRSQRNQCDIR